MYKYALILALVLFLPACAITESGKIRDCTEDYIELGALGYDSLNDIHSICSDIYRPGYGSRRSDRRREMRAHR